jgi:lipopolysaccharide transport system ATP-binding protein
MTGRENIYLNGAILGMTKAEIKSKIDEIIAFSGCERYIDTPVKRYSSGMTVRLAFSVAAHLEPDILVVDEVLAVGDAEFQKKAIGKMQDISKGEGRTVLFVSHNMAAVKKLCPNSIVLHNGSMAFHGDTESAVDFYINENFSLSFENPVFKSSSLTVKGPKINKCSLIDVNGELRNIFKAGEPITIELSIIPDENEIRDYSVVWFVRDKYEEDYAICSSGRMNNTYYSSETTSIKCKINTEALISGEYTFRYVLHVPGDINFDDWNKAISFKIIEHDIHSTGFEYTSIWSPKTFLNSVWS